MGASPKAARSRPWNVLGPADPESSPSATENHQASAATESVRAPFKSSKPDCPSGSALVGGNTVDQAQWMYVGCIKDVRAIGQSGAIVKVEVEICSGTGIRTLNLAVNRSLQHVQK